MGADTGHSYRIASGVQNNANLSSSTVVVAGIAGYRLALKKVVISVVGASVITIEDEDGADHLILNLGATTTVPVLEFAPGQRMGATAGQGISVDSNVATGTTAYIECWVHPA